MDLLQRARERFHAGRMHDALEAAQAGCDRAPKDPEAWWLLGRVARHTGLPAASDEAFRRANTLSRRHPIPHRVPRERFDELVAEARESLSPDARRRLERATVRVQPLPTAVQVTGGVDPDALTGRERQPADVLTVFQVNHENRCATETALRALIVRSLSRA